MKRYNYIILHNNSILEKGTINASNPEVAWEVLNFKILPLFKVKYRISNLNARLMLS